MSALPPLLTGSRRGLMVRLVGCATLHAAVAVGTALLVGRLVGATAGQLPWLVVAAAIALGGMAATKYAERVLAERLGQDYVHELRGRLVSIALAGEGGPSLGITIARTTNDLSSVRSWVAQGIAPLVAAVPLILGSVAVLGWLHWSLAAATTVPLLVLAVVLAVVSRTAYRRARALRRRRGRLAARLSDTLHARESILTAGGQDRELRRIDEDSRRVVAAAVARSRTAGILQAITLTTAASMAALVALAARTGGVEASAVATALTIAGVLAAPLGETGRIVEFRQNYRAARRILGPLLATHTPPVANADTRQHRDVVGTVQVCGQVCQVDGQADGQASGAVGADTYLSFAAHWGERLHLVGPDAAQVSAALRQIAAPHPTEDLVVVIDGWDHTRLPPRRRRELVGLASHGTALERGTIARAVRYRRPDLDPDHATAAIRRVGLDATVSGLTNGERTELRRGGHPLAPADIARLTLARAITGAPPLLLLDRIDAALDDAGREMLTSVVDQHPGIVVFASDHPDRVAPDHRTVHLGFNQPRPAATVQPATPRSAPIVAR